MSAPEDDRQSKKQRISKPNFLSSTTSIFDLPGISTTTTTTTTTKTSSTVTTSSAVSISHQADIANHYNKIQTKSFAERNASEIIGLKSFNNWVKSVLINQFCPRNPAIISSSSSSHYSSSPPDSFHTGATVLDICCGKGGDLKKFVNSHIGYYVGADHAGKSVQDAVDRYNELNKRGMNRGLPPFPALFMTSDCHHARLSLYLPSHIWFDLISCQFALHYSFESEERARQLMMNISERLLPGGYFVATFPDANVLVKRGRNALEEKKESAGSTVGTTSTDTGLDQGHDGEEKAVNGSGTLDTPVCSFGNSIFSVRFITSPAQPLASPFGIKYIFRLIDAIDECPEYLVHLPTLQAIAADHGLELMHSWGLHELFHEMIGKDEHRNTAERMKVIGKDATGITEEEWEVLNVYMAVVFKKKGPHEFKSSAASASSASSSSSPSSSSSSSSEMSDSTRPAESREGSSSSSSSSSSPSSTSSISTSTKAVNPLNPAFPPYYTLPPLSLKRVVGSGLTPEQRQQKIAFYSKQNIFVTPELRNTIASMTTSAGETGTTVHNTSSGKRERSTFETV